MLDDSDSWITGTEEAENRITTGGWTPGGITARIEFMAETTWEIARSMLTLCWKYTFSIAVPGSVVLSIRLMSLTLLDSENSLYVVIRCVMSVASRPL